MSSSRLGVVVGGSGTDIDHLMNEMSRSMSSEELSQQPTVINKVKSNLRRSSSLGALDLKRTSSKDRYISKGQDNLSIHEKTTDNLLDSEFTSAHTISKALSSAYSVSTRDQIILSFADFKHQDIYPTKHRQAIDQVRRLAKFSSERHQSIYDPPKRLAVKKEKTGSLASLGKLALFKKEPAVSTLPKQPMYSPAETFHLLRISIRDHKSDTACRIFSNLSDPFLADTRNIPLLHRYFLEALCSGMEPLCLLMMDRNIPTDVNSPAFLSDESSIRLPNYLHLSISFDLDKLAYRLVREVDVNKTWCGVSPLMLAISNNKKTLVKKLLELGAEMSIGLLYGNLLKFQKTQVFKHGDSAFDEYPQSSETVELDPIELEKWLSKYILPLEIALAIQSDDMFRLLIQKTNNALVKKMKFAMLLTRDLKQLASLVKLGAHVEDFVNERGANPLHLACRRGDIQLVIYFISTETNINEAGENGWTPVQEAIARKNKKIVQYLRLNGADLTKVNNQKQDAFDIARKSGYSDEEIQDVLIANVDSVQFDEFENQVESLAQPMSGTPKIGRPSSPRFFSPKLKQIIGSEAPSKHKRSSTALSGFSLFNKM